MRNVLVISYYFPPAGGPGVQTVSKHVKYLRELGYNPIVIAATPSGLGSTAGPPDGTGIIFAAVGSATDSLVGYAGSSVNTKPGNYALTVSALATQGSTTGSAAIGSTTIVAATNDILNLTVDGVSASVTLAAGTYTNAEIAAQLQSLINGVAAYKTAGISATVSQSGGVFTITSTRYGSASNVSITGGNGATNLFGLTPTSTAGVDAAGTINGVAAVGSGQNLTGATGTLAEGLKRGRRGRGSRAKAAARGRTSP